MLEKNIEVIKLGPYFASSQTVEEIEDIGMEARGIGPLQDEEYDNELINVTPPPPSPPPPTGTTTYRHALQRSRPCPRRWELV